MEEIRNDELLMELRNVTEEWKKLLQDMKTTKKLPATYYLKFPVFMEYMGIGQSTAKKLVKAAEAMAWIDGTQMVNVIKVHKYLDSINE